jgi:cell division protein FtsL
MSQYKATTRVAALSPALSLPAVDLKLWGARILIPAFCLMSLLALTATRIESTKLRYQINTLYQRREVARAEIGRLETEMSTIMRPQRVESVARGMGMVVPHPSQVIAMNE